MYLRPILPQDREALAALLRRIENFVPRETEVAMELIDEAIERPQSGYKCIVASNPGESGENLAGYICFGRTPMTDHTYDLYWIAVDPKYRGKGVGVKLLRAMEEALLHNGGRIIRVETSTLESYDGTIEFYLNAGFEMAGRIPRFYKDTDDLLILYKVLG